MLLYPLPNQPPQRSAALEEIGKQGLDLLGVIPQDEDVYEFDSEGKPTVTLPETSAARRAVNEIAEKLFTII